MRASFSSLPLYLISLAYRQTGHKKSKKAPTATHSALEDEEHVLSILSSLFTTLESDSVPRIRLLAKFVEADYEKVDRLIEMMEGAEGRLRNVHQEIELEQQVSPSASIVARLCY